MVGGTLRADSQIRSLVMPRSMPRSYGLARADSVQGLGDDLKPLQEIKQPDRVG